MPRSVAKSAAGALLGAALYVPGADASFARDTMLRTGQGTSIADVGPPPLIECATGVRLSEIASDWLDLIGRAHEPNVFQDPAVVQLAERHLHGGPRATLLAWQQSGEGNKLVGVWAFCIGRPGRSLLPVRMLMAPPLAHAYLATPVIDRTAVDGALNAMLDFIAQEPSLPKLISIDPMRTDGPTMQALTRVLHSRASAHCVMAETRRPMLASEFDGKQYLDRALSSSTRKKLRQHRRRLEEKGSLEFKVWNGPEAVCAAFDDFLRLEAAGWKGRSGTALLSSPAEASFAKDMVAALALRGDASIYALNVDGRPVSMQVVLRAGPVAFTWKTAYDEAVHDVSPGTLLLEDYTKEFLADESIAAVDSCVYDEDGYMSAWTERQTIAQVWIDARSGRSVPFLALCRCQKAFLRMRSVAKGVYRSWTRKWNRA